MNLKEFILKNDLQNNQAYILNKVEYVSKTNQLPSLAVTLLCIYPKNDGTYFATTNSVFINKNYKNYESVKALPLYSKVQYDLTSVIGQKVQIINIRGVD